MGSSPVSLPVWSLRMGETPPTGAIECFNERPNVEKRLATKQALTSFSTKVEEGRRIAVMLSVSVPTALIIPSASAVPLRHCSDDWMSLVLLVQRAVPVLLCSSKFASFRQTTLSSQLSSELVGLCPKSSNDKGYKLRPLEVVSFLNTLSAEQRSPETKASDIRPFSKPGITQAYLSYSRVLRDGGESIAGHRTGQL